MKSVRETHRSSQRRSLGRAQDSGRQDPYEQARKLPQPSVCRQCGAVYQNGRWSWSTVPQETNRVLCDACRRIDERQPAGLLTLSGSYLGDPRRRSELVRLIRHQEKAESAEHPHNRIMEIQEEPDRIVVTTTDIHLPRRIGEAVRSAHGGELALSFEEDGYFLRAAWRRE